MHFPLFPFDAGKRKRFWTAGSFLPVFFARFCLLQKGGECLLFRRGDRQWRAKLFNEKTCHFPVSERRIPKLFVRKCLFPYFLSEYIQKQNIILCKKARSVKSFKKMQKILNFVLNFFPICNIIEYGKVRMPCYPTVWSAPARAFMRRKISGEKFDGEIKWFWQFVWIRAQMLPLSSTRWMSARSIT